MVSSASAQIEATGGDQLRTTIIVNGKESNVPDYATVSNRLGRILMDLTLVLGPGYSNRSSCCIRTDRNYSGPRVRQLTSSPTRASHPCRNHGSHFEKAKTAFEQGGGRDELVTNNESDSEDRGANDKTTESVDEKASAHQQQREGV